MSSVRVRRCSPPGSPRRNRRRASCWETSPRGSDRGSLEKDPPSAGTSPAAYRCIAREQQDYTPHKTDESDCVLIGRLAAELHCYIPEELDEAWAQLRHLGRRRAKLITAATASGQRIGDFLSVTWPVVTEVCAQPFKSVTWLAALQVVTSRCGGDPARLAAMGPEEFTAVVRAAVPAWGGKKGWGTICGRVFAATADTEGVVAWSRRGLLRRVADELGDLARTRAQLRAVAADMVMVLSELGLSRLGDIPGLTAVGAAAILAETGDPRRYDSSSSLVKHAGLSPSENASGAFAGQARISRRGRPGLRLTAWRAVWPMLRLNPVMAAKYAAMTQAADAAVASDAGSQPARAAASAARARRAKARVACAASLLRWIYSMAGCGTSWDAAVASGAAACQHAPRCQPEAA